MQVKKAATVIINRYFNPNFTLNEQLFHLLTLVGIAAGIIVAVLSAINYAGIPNIILNLVIAAFSAVLLRVVEKKKRYRLCSWIVVIAVFLVVFTILFFTAGGYRSGMPSFFVFALVLTAVLMEKTDRIAAFLLECAIYTANCTVAYYYPEMVTYFPEERFVAGDVIIGILLVGVLLTVIFLLGIRLYRLRQVQADGLNRELLERNEVLARYDRMKSEFLDIVTHEISTPMTTIMASSRDTLDLLGEQPLNTEEIEENQRRIESKVMLVDRIITDLVDAVAIENGRLSLNCQMINLPELLEISCDAHFKQHDINNNSIAYDLRYDVPEINADPVRIEQVMLNLLSNAVRHTYNDTIEVKLERLDGVQVVSVTDHGEGMDADTLQAVFEQRKSSREDYWRHGMGLHICNIIVTAHGG